MITCQNCGEINIKDIQIYNESLRKQLFRLSPILPTCKHCGAEVAVSHKCEGGNIIILNGTCGSGKSTIAELLQDMGWSAIDGDCAIQVIKHKYKIKNVDSKAILDEIASEIDILSLLNSNIVVSNIVLPEDLDNCIKIIRERKMNYKLILLKPDYQVVVQRCQTRTCHNSITPEYWIRYFYDLLVFDNKFKVIDNTDMTAAETVDYILNRINYEI